METQKPADTVFVVKDNQQYCFLFDSDDALELFRSIVRCAGTPGSALELEDAVHVMEGMVPERLRSI
jgi:hypothetical protein